MSWLAVWTTAELAWVPIVLHQRRTVPAVSSSPAVARRGARSFIRGYRPSCGLRLVVRLRGPQDRPADEREPGNARHALPPETVADFIAWIATAPPELVRNEATVTPLDEQGWP
jgi:hypothetical protein